MLQDWDPDEDVPVLPRRDERLPPPWFERDPEPINEARADDARTAPFSWPRTLGLLALVLLIILIPLDFVSNYAATDAMGRTNLTLGFVWAIVIEALAIWGLIRLLTRR